MRLEEAFYRQTQKNKHDMQWEQKVRKPLKILCRVHATEIDFEKASVLLPAA